MISFKCLTTVDSHCANRTWASVVAATGGYNMGMVSGTSCPPELFTCHSGSRITCAEKCNGVNECDGGEDEEDCGGTLVHIKYICVSKISAVGVPPTSSYV